MSNDSGQGTGGREPAGRTDWLGWREATEQALYGPDGFFVRERPADHFRTSVHASPLFAASVAELLRRTDAALGHPDELTLLDVGAGRGELLLGVQATVERTEPGLGARLRLCAVERAPRPNGLDPSIAWLPDLPGPGSVTGLLLANEWLDNVPVDVAETDSEGVPRTVLVTRDGDERLEAPVTAADAEWLARWWPLGGDPGLRAGLRAEIGRPRDAAWATAVGCLARGFAVAVDYGHDRGGRPPFGTLAGFRDGHEVRPVPDGSCDLTSHVALDACAAAGSAAAAEAVGGAAGSGADTAVDATADAAGERPESRSGPVLLSQRDALRAFGVSGERPPLALASSDPAAYVRALSSAGEAAELTDPAGLGAFTWLVQPVGLPPSALAATGLPPANEPTASGG